MFKVRHAEETICKTFRFPESLVERMSVVAQKENISLNNLVIQCCEYAIKNMVSSDEKNSKEK